jgi:hypothetical protein
VWTILFKEEQLLQGTCLEGENSSSFSDLNLLSYECGSDFLASLYWLAF